MIPSQQPPSLLACTAGDPEQSPGRGQPPGAGQRCGMGGTCCLHPACPVSLLLFPAADLGGERERKRAALGTGHPATRDWPAQPFPVLGGFSRELLASMWEQEAARKQIPASIPKKSGSPHPSAAPGVNKGVPKAGIKTSGAVTSGNLERWGLFSPEKPQ